MPNFCEVTSYGSYKVVLTRAIRHHIQEDDILHSHCRENLKSHTISYSADLKICRAIEVS
jgi:hypothetical protein